MPRGQTSERQAPAGQPSGERNEERVREQSIEYWRCRRRCSWALGVIAASIVVLTIFHTPAAWGDGRIAYALRTVAWVALVVAALVAYRNNGRACEVEGFCRGRYRLSAKELMSRAADRV